VQAKTHAECYHYLFEAAVRMAQLGLSAAEGEAKPALGVAAGGKR
jgi:hypothetical protein